MSNKIFISEEKFNSFIITIDIAHMSYAGVKNPKTKDIMFLSLSENAALSHLKEWFQENGYILINNNKLIEIENIFKTLF